MKIVGFLMRDTPGEAAEVSMPRGAEILAVSGTANGAGVRLEVAANPDAPEDVRRFQVFSIQDDVPPDARHVGSCHFGQSSRAMLHVFELDARAAVEAEGGYDRSRDHHDFDSAEERRAYYRRHAPSIVAAAAVTSNVLGRLLRRAGGPGEASDLAAELEAAMEKLLIAFS